MNKTHVTRCIAVPAMLAMMMAGCAATESGQKGPAVKKSPAKPLRVGITPDSPPIIFTRNDKAAGVEADFAQGIANKLDRPIRFVPLKWEGQIPALLDEKIDVIMSGMSVTRARRLRIDFTTPYLTNGLMTLMRCDDAERYDSPEKIYATRGTIGVQVGTTADVFVRRKCPWATIATYVTTDDAVRALKTRKIDLFIGDGHTIAWLVSENEADLSGLFVPLTEEYLAWGVRRGDEKLLKSLNGILEEWEKDGTLRRILTKWLPYLKN